MTEIILVAGAQSGAREAAIAADLDPAISAAVILEGIADAGGALADPSRADYLSVIRIGAGCPCCSGNLILRVTLNRLLRRAPRRLYISLADPAHLESMRLFLQQSPYEKLLSITKVLRL